MIAVLGSTACCSEPSLVVDQPGTGEGPATARPDGELRERTRGLGQGALGMRPQRRLIDLSIYLENGVLSDPQLLAPKITYQKHADTLPEVMAIVPGTTPEDYPEGEAAAAGLR